MSGRHQPENGADSAEALAHIDEEFDEYVEDLEEEDPQAANGTGRLLTILAVIALGLAAVVVWLAYIWIS